MTHNQHLTEILVWADGTADTEAYWSERRKLWCFIDWLNHGDTFVAESWVEVTLNPAGLPGDFRALDGLGPEECGLNQRSIACDLEAPGGRWVVDAADFTELQDVYGDALVITRRGTNQGEVANHG